MLHGADQGIDRLEGLLSASELAAIGVAAVAHSVLVSAQLPIAAVERLVASWIVNGQSIHQNIETSPLGYFFVDRFEVPESLVTVFCLSSGSMATVELISDVYLAN